MEKTELPVPIQSKGNTMSQYREIVKSVLTEAKAGMHPMGVHAHPMGKGQYKVHATGSKVNPQHVKPGDVLRSSHLDDLSAAGHKVKETNPPKE
jgi:hypothetical protein